jgi:hypothetical protein
VVRLNPTHRVYLLTSETVCSAGQQVSEKTFSAAGAARRGVARNQEQLNPKLGVFRSIHDRKKNINRKKKKQEKNIPIEKKRSAKQQKETIKTVS